MAKKSSTKRGFKKIFGSKTTEGSKDFDQMYPAAAIRRDYDTFDDRDDDFEYRGVTNNPDSLFKSSAPTSGTNTGTNTRYNSSSYNPQGPYYNPETTVPEHEPYYHHSDEFDPSDIDDDDDDDNLLQVDRGNIFGDGNASNNSRSRFTEEI